MNRRSFLQSLGLAVAALAVSSELKFLGFEAPAIETKDLVIIDCTDGMGKVFKEAYKNNETLKEFLYMKNPFISMVYEDGDMIRR